jgi:hypothetical protein
MVLQMLASAVVAVVVAFLASLAFGNGDGEIVDPAAARHVALAWTGAELAERPRWDGERWEVDVRRADGSIIEVNLDRYLELRELDQELGPHGSAAHDEITGTMRERAIGVARSRSITGPVGSVEREPDGTIEVNIVQPDGSVVEVELGPRLRVIDIDREELGDE